MSIYESIGESPTPAQFIEKNKRRPRSVITPNLLAAIELELRMGKQPKVVAMERHLAPSYICKVGQAIGLNYRKKAVNPT